MPKIVIKEYDETTVGSAAENNEVVYIPGCVDISQTSLYKDNEYVGLQPNVPTLFTSVSSFETACGASGLKFERDWDYRELTSDGASAFSSNAVPYHSIIFTKGTVDPGYVMAKELLASGLNVVYERINKDGSYKNVPATVADSETWELDYKNYVTDIAILNTIADSAAPSDFSTRAFYTFAPLTCDSIDSEGNITKNTEFAKTSTSASNVLFPLAKISQEFIDSYSSVAKDSKYSESTLYYRKDNETYKVISKESLIEGSYIVTDSANGHKFTDTAVNNIYTKSTNTQYFHSYEDANGNVQKAILDVAGNSTITYKGVEYVLINNATLYKVNLSTDSLPIDWSTKYWKNYFELTEATNVSYPTPHLEVGAKSGLKQSTSTAEISISISVKTQVKGVQLDEVYTALSGIYNGESDDDTGFTSGLADKGNYNIKYITSGGYPVYEYANNIIAKRMAKLAATRGDCYALIDHTDNLGRSTDINNSQSLFKCINDVEFDNGEYAAMFTPWATYTRLTTDRIGKELDSNPSTMRMPASFAYLQSLANSLKTNAPWLAIAGAARGGVRYLAEGGMTTVISNGVADAMQPRNATTQAPNGISINAITNIKPYGWTIWGNRTLKSNKEGLLATSFLNIRNLLCDVKKVVYRSARALTFEQDNEVLWINFKSKIAPTLDRMLSGYGISGYKIIRNTQHEKANEKATVCARIILYPTYAVEDFYIDIVLKDGEVAVESNA